nr:hypothetical protein [Tanacetum cinerariifolium]
MHPCIAWDKVDNPSPQSTPQVLPSFEEYTPPVTHPKEVKEIIEIPMEVEPLDHIKLEDLGLNTNTHDLFLSYKGFPNVDEPGPKHLPNFSPLDVNLGEKRGTDPPINPYILDRTVIYPKGIAENVLVGIGKFVFSVHFIILDMPEDVKVTLILRRLFFSTAHTKIDVFKRKITLRVGNEKIIFKSMKPASSLIKRVYMLSLRERMELDLEAGLMGKTLELNRSLDPLYRDYIELNDLNIPLELKRNQVDNLISTIKECEVIDEPMIDIIKTRNNEGFDEYPSFCEFDRKIHNDCAYNLRFLCMIVENMDGYRDQDMEDIILGELFYKASCVKARRHQYGVSAPYHTAY